LTFSDGQRSESGGKARWSFDTPPSFNGAYGGGSADGRARKQQKPGGNFVDGLLDDPRAWGRAPGASMAPPQPRVKSQSLDALMPFREASAPGLLPDHLAVLAQSGLLSDAQLQESLARLAHPGLQAPHYSVRG